MHSNTTKILFITNNPKQVELINKCFANNAKFKIAIENSFTNAIKYIAQNKPALVYSNLTINNETLQSFITNLAIQNTWEFENFKQLPIVAILNNNTELSDTDILNKILLNSIIINDYECKILPKITDLFISNWQHLVEKKYAEEKMQMLLSAVEQSPSSIIITNINGNIEYANPKCAEITGYTVNELIGKNPRVLKSSEMSEESYKKLWQTITKGQQWNGVFHNKKKNGDLYWEKASISPVVIDAKIMHYIAIKEDITLQKHIENELIKSEERYKNLINTAPVLIMVVKNDSFLFVNPYAAKLLGYTTHNQLYNTNIYNTFSTDDKKLISEKCKNALNGNKNDAIELKIKSEDGQTLWILSVSIPMEFDNEPAMLIIGNDISKQKEFEQELIKAKVKAEESDKLKSAFLANMSHEIRTPMNGIMGFAELLSRESISTDKKLYYSESIIKCTRQLLNIVNDIIDLSKIETGQILLNITNINLNSILTEVFNLYNSKATEKGIKLNISNNNNILIQTDRNRLLQVLCNLVGNAVKFTIAGSVNISYNINNNFIEFIISDTGIGIAPEHHHKLFGRFQQVHLQLADQFGGAGLGLAISRSLIQLMGGNIWFNSEQNKGSTFCFTLPLIKTNPMNQTKNNIIEKHIKRKGIKNILIAEDDDNSFILLKEVLENKGYNIYKALNGAEAIEKCNQNKIDLVLMDIKMPIINGLEATRVIKRSYPHLPIIALTAFAFADDELKTAQAGCDNYMAKPIKVNELLQLIEKYDK